MSLYGRLNSTATTNIRKYGASYTFTKETQGAFDPSSGTVATTLSTYTAYAVRDEYSSNERADSSIEIGDIKLIAEVANYGVNDTVDLDGEIYRIVESKPIKPGATVLMYELRVRK